MADFPIGGTADAVRVWLDKKGFLQIFIGFEADALMGLEKDDILSILHGDKGIMLWGLLNTARRQGDVFYFFFQKCFLN